MSSFLSTMTTKGKAIVAGFERAQTHEDFNQVVRTIATRDDTDAHGRPGLTDADSYAFQFTVASRMPKRPKFRASVFDNAADLALRHKAYPEALDALLQAEKIWPSKARRADIENLEKVLARQSTKRASSGG